MSVISKKESEVIYILKGFAILSVICAHISLNVSKSNLIDYFLERFYKSFGCVGVAIFFFLSGYLFTTKEIKFKEFFYSKTLKLIIPWLFTGTLIFFYIGIRKGGINLFNWINFILGNGSYLYYMTLLILYFLMFFYIKKMWIINFLIIISLFSIWLSRYNIIGINNYLNPFNFYIYFAAGYCFRKKCSLIQLYYQIKRYKFCLINLYFLLFVITIYFNLQVNYWGEFIIIKQVVFFLILLILSNEISYFKNILANIGKYSFSLYLLHMPFAGLINKVNDLYFSLILRFFSPFIILILTIISIIIYTKLFNQRIFKSLIGLN